MRLGDIVQRIREEIEADDVVREKVLPLTRAAVRLCSESIKKTHRGDYDDAKDSLQSAHGKISDAKAELAKSEFVGRTRVLDVAYQELAEAASLLSLLSSNEITPPDEFDIPSRPYLTGLADTVGELRRATLESLRRDKVERAEELLVLMEEILEEIGSLDFPNALIPDLRRKCDIARSLVERTRADVTTAVRQDRLVKEMKSFEKEIKEE
jgi:translin